MTDNSGPRMEMKTSRHKLHGSGDGYLRELVAFHDMAATITTNNANVIEDWVAANKVHISEEDLAELPDLIDKMVDALTRAAAYMKSTKDSSLSDGKFEPIEIESSRPGPQAVVQDLFLKIAVNALIDRVELVGRAFLISAISSFEVLFGNLIRAICDRNPTALSASEYSFTLEELSQYCSIQEARQALVTRKVEALTREGVDVWGKWLKRTVNIDLTGIVEEWPLVREIFARRNILVHADGKVDQRYLQALQGVSIDTSSLVLGKKLDLPLSYLRESLERLIAFGVLLNFAVWTRLYKTELEEGVQSVVSSQEFLVRHEMWLATRLISAHIGQVDCRRRTSLSTQINGWLARKKLQGVESIRDEVLSWDITGLSSRYVMIKCLLLNDNHEAKAHVLNELQTGKLTHFEVATHPLFSDFRLIDPSDGSLKPSDSS